MKSEQKRLPFSDKAIRALEVEIDRGKFLFTSAELLALGIDPEALKVETGVVGITIPGYLRKIYNDSLCDVSFGKMAILPLVRDENTKLSGSQKFVSIKCPVPLFNLIHEVRNLSTQIRIKRNTAWSYQHDSEMYRHNEKVAADMATKLMEEAKQLKIEHDNKMLALQKLCAQSSAIRLEVMELIMSETSIVD